MVVKGEIHKRFDGRLALLKNSLKNPGGESATLWLKDERMTFEEEFKKAFEQLTGNRPFPWQTDLYDNWFRQGKFPPSCNLPTGLGKTSVIAVWLIALANGAKVPRRLVYVVNRRTVVDQTTNETERYRENLRGAGLDNALRQMCASGLSEKESPLAISTLRGQFADNREWSADPSRPAVICGTVDMIGSRLLFSGYGVGFKGKPLHAGFLGQDALLVHDEAHLEPAFQELIKAIEKEQKRERDSMKAALPWSALRVMELTATSRGNGEVFPNEEQRKANETDPEVSRRIDATKCLALHQLNDDTKLADEVAARSLKFEGKGVAVLVFLQRVADVQKVMDKLPKGRKQLLTGTIRGLERDRMANPMIPEGCPIFARFLPSQKEDTPEKERWKVTPATGTVYLVCTSAGEVGVNISADHLVSDLTTFESMAQRLGRVNRFGKRSDTEVHVFYPKAYDAKLEYDTRRQRTKKLLDPLDRKSASPKALGELDADARKAAFAPTPTILPATDILFDAWALTTIRDKLPGRPPVEPYLHGLAEWQPPETFVAWREEVGEIQGDMLAEYDPAELLDTYPLKPHELLHEPSYRAFKHFEAMANRCPKLPVWLLDDDGKVEVLTVAELADKGKKDRIEGMTVLLSPSAGGLEGGMLNGESATAADVADEWFLKDHEGKLTRQRKRLLHVDPNDDPEAKEMHKVLSITFPGADDDAEEKTWEWFAVANEGDKSAKLPVLWTVHVGDVVRHARAIVGGLTIDEQLKQAVITAAMFHDHGKRRAAFQRVLGNFQNAEPLLAKSGNTNRKNRLKEDYRHEFGSLMDVVNETGFTKLNPELQDLVLHLIATHHGFGRPHFPNPFDPEPPPGVNVDAIAKEVPRRFARLQRKYGRWGLAYLESLLRAADWAASANPSAFVKEGE